MRFAHPSGMQWNSSKVTDHNRQPIQIATERIEKKTRTWNGTTRVQHIASKHTFTCSWENVPDYASHTVDNLFGAEDMHAFYLANTGAFTLTIYHADNTSSVYNVVFNDFSKDIVKRGRYDLCNVSVTLEEV